MTNNLLECINLIERTYNTFNGTINPINKAGSLMIDTHDSNLCAYMDRHNVIIYANTLLQRFENYIEEITVETVLHELSHFDQVIDFYRYMEDVEYREQIEHANTLNSLEYMMRNIDYINNVLGTNISKSFIGSLYTQAVQKIYSFPYNRIGYNTLYLNTLKMLRGFDNIEYIIDSVPNIDLCVTIDSRVAYFTISKNGKFNIDTGGFNRFMYKYIRMYDKLRYYCDYEVTNDNSYCQFRIFLKDHYMNPILIYKK